VHIKMKVTRQGTQDGVNVEEFEKDKRYKICDDLAEVFCKEGWAEVCEAEKQETEEEKKLRESKDAGGSKENKDAGKPDENKSVTDIKPGEFRQGYFKAELEKMDLPELKKIAEPLKVEGKEKNELVEGILNAQSLPVASASQEPASVIGKLKKAMVGNK
jgi:hypothetical protein